MASTKLKSLIYSRKIRKALNKKGLMDSGISGKMGLILDAENLDTKQELANIYKKLEVRKEDFRIVVCGHEKDLKLPFPAEILNSKEVSLSGEFKSERIREFVDNKFDFLICYFSEKNILGSLLAAETNASVKIGNKPDEYGVYDMEIDSKEIDVFQQEVLKYLKILKRNN